MLTLIGVAILQSPLIIKGSEGLFDEKNRIFIYRRWISVLLMLPICINQTVEPLWHLSNMNWLFFVLNAFLILIALLEALVNIGIKTDKLSQVDLSGQPALLHMGNALSWIAYLFLYELLIRSLLINELRHAGMDLMGALWISFTIYVLLHLFQGMRITMASIPFGILATVWIYETGSLLPVILLHVVCALGYDYCMLLSNKNINHEGVFNGRYGISGK